ncbi:MAG: hypothetical protein MMC33_005140 [Icmadophila ericetorum]|nr:hypothetical protein [Icmadophila ericetorum]
MSFWTPKHPAMREIKYWYGPDTLDHNRESDFDPDLFNDILFSLQMEGSGRGARSETPSVPRKRDGQRFYPPDDYLPNSAYNNPCQKESTNPKKSLINSDWIEDNDMLIFPDDLKPASTPPSSSARRPYAYGPDFYHHHPQDQQQPPPLYRTPRPYHATVFPTYPYDVFPEKYLFSRPPLPYSSPSTFHRSTSYTYMPPPPPPPSPPPLQRTRAPYASAHAHAHAYNYNCAYIPPLPSPPPSRPRETNDFSNLYSHSHSYLGSLPSQGGGEGGRERRHVHWEEEYPEMVFKKGGMKRRSCWPEGLPPLDRRVEVLDE